MSVKPTKPEGKPSKPRYSAKLFDKSTDKVAKKLKASKAEILSVDETPQRQMAVFNESDDYQLALVGLSLLEDMLRAAIKMHMVDMDNTIESSIFSFDNSGPLSSLSSKTRMAFVLGIIDLTVRSEIDIIRSIRNHFAHNRISPPSKTTLCGQTVKDFQRCPRSCFSHTLSSYPHAISSRRHAFA